MPRQENIVTASATRLVALLALFLSSLVAPAFASPIVGTALERNESAPAISRLESGTPRAVLVDAQASVVRQTVEDDGHDGPAPAILPAAPTTALPSDASQKDLPPVSLGRSRSAGHFFSARAPPLG